MAGFYCVLMFLAGLILLVSGSSFFVDSAVSVAKKLHMSEVVVGATIVSLGTTLPEILFSTTAAFRGYTDLAIGNALGSILCNTGFIAGILIFIRTIPFTSQGIKNVKSNMIFLAVSSALYLLSGFLFSGLPRFIGCLLVLTGFCFLRYSAGNVSFSPARTPAGEEGHFTVSDVIRLILEAAAIYTGAQFLLKYGPELARLLGIPEIVISLTFVAAGTSLPELVTSLISLKKKHASLSLGNILGADILNLVFVGGLSAVIHPLPLSSDILALELPFILLMLSVLCIPVIVLRRTGRTQGLLLVAGYGLYLCLMLARQS